MTVYAFEAIGDSLDFEPLAARRAFAVSGCRLDVQAWRKLAHEGRLEIVRIGSSEKVDVAKVRALAFGVPHAEEDATSDPDAESVPPLLVRALPAGQMIPDAAWRALTPLDRWALVALASAAPSMLDRALDEIARTPGRSAGPRRLSTHLTDAGEVHMVDVTAKEVTTRTAVACARVHMSEETFGRLAQRDTPKGAVLATARIAGIQAAKRTWELIPLCHSLALTSVDVDIDLIGGGIVEVRARCEARDRTGVEMEAMVAATTAALTIYDMLKGIDRTIRFEVELLEKAGGRSGRWTR
jgi:cyclic pyranopterin phosphate synthase